MILTGALVPGQRVPELHLVDRTGVSRTPLRIAMERLAHEGLLERRSRGGFVVRAFTRAQIEHAIEARGVLEGAAARLAAERVRHAEEIDRLVGLVARLEPVVAAFPEMHAFDEYVDLNQAFHDELVTLSGNEMLGTLIKQVLALPFASPNAFVLAHASAPESRQIIVIGHDQHRSIVDAIRRGEGTRAESLGREHARLALRNLDAALRDTERLRGVPGGALIKLN
jgi:GntR family transcriptional regulator of vanillate catabolism